MQKTPVIGILCMDISKKSMKKFGEKYKFYIPASYVKFLERAGAKVIPIWNNKDEDYYKDMLSIINGILIPGGGISFRDPNNGKAAYTTLKIYQIAKDFNENGIYFPIWGTCLGYELLLFASSNSAKNTRFPNGTMTASLPLNFEKDFRKSKLFRDLPTQLIAILEREPVTFHHHSYCITKDMLDDLKLSHEWRVTSSNMDNNKIKFISSIEHKTLPFYGVAFHPEKIEFDSHRNVPHTPNAIMASQYYADFFVSECRRNGNYYLNKKHQNYLIQNYEAKTTGKEGLNSRQCYVFQEDPSYLPSYNIYRDVFVVDYNVLCF